MPWCYPEFLPHSAPTIQPFPIACLTCAVALGIRPIDPLAGCHHLGE